MEEVEAKIPPATVSLKALVEGDGEELDLQLQDDLFTELDEYEMSESDQTQIEERKRLLQSGFKELAKKLLGEAATEFRQARDEHRQHLARMSKKKRRTEEGVWLQVAQVNQPMIQAEHLWGPTGRWRRSWTT